MPRGVPTRLRGTAGRAVKAQTPGRGRGEEGRGRGGRGGGGGAACAPPQSAASAPSSARACSRGHLRQGCCRPPGRRSPSPALPGLFPRAAAHEGGARRERQEAASAAARFPPAPSGGGAALTCRAVALGLRGALAASAHVHAGHLRHQLPQRRLNGSELQPPPPLPPMSLRRSRAAPARRPLALDRTKCLRRHGWRCSRTASWLGSQGPEAPRARRCPRLRLMATTGRGRGGRRRAWRGARGSCPPSSPPRLAQWSRPARPCWLLCVCVFVCVLYVKGGEGGNDCCGPGLGAGIRACSPRLHSLKRIWQPPHACSRIPLHGARTVMLLRGLHHPKNEELCKNPEMKLEYEAVAGCAPCRPLTPRRMGSAVSFS